MHLISILAILALVAVDQLIKNWAAAVLAPVGAMPFIPHFIELRYLLNEGAAFSMLSGKQFLLILVTGIAIAAMCYWLFFRCKNDQLMRWALILLIGGGIGNLVDRVLAGQVIDYLNFLFIQFPVFNFADIAVCTGVGLLLLDVLFGKDDETKAA